AGKTSILRCVARLEERWTGEIRLDGVSIRKLSRRELARQIAFVRQFAPPNCDFAARKIVEFGRLPYLRPMEPPTRRDADAIDAALDRVGAAAFADRRFNSLSGGERQRIRLAAAFAQTPALLILDEPTTFLDYPSQTILETAIADWTRETGGTVLEATHELNRAALFSDVALAMRAGRLILNLPAREITSAEALTEIFGVATTTVPAPGSGIPMILPDGARGGAAR
ncbi:MAG: ABC transporter ATP-binding protein, partial [Thermoguttaceae bacterium]|nr:ABC transporter ATP-binding protein [Thermoguttaceae bacterium]